MSLRDRIARAGVLGATFLLPCLAAAGDMQVNAGAKYFGGFGPQVLVTDSFPTYVEDDSPGLERRYQARFYLKLNALTQATGDEFDVFAALAPGDVPQLRVSVGRTATQTQLRLSARRDDGTFASAAPIDLVLPREWHSVEIDWKAAAAPAANDGALAVWVDGQSRPGLTALDNDQGQIATVRWGAVEGLEGTTTGSFLLDEFESRRDGYIGLLSVFQDVPSSDPFWNFVHAIYNAGVTSGCTPTNYCPSAPVTRGQMAVFLLRSREGSAYLPPACAAAPFSDVPVTHPFCSWIQELSLRGITSGCSAGSYCPEAAASRAQMAVFLLRSKEGSGYNPPACNPASPPFQDVPATSPFCPFIQELSVRGITGGCAPGFYCPDASISRGQMAVFLSRTFALPVPVP